MKKLPFNQDIIIPVVLALLVALIYLKTSSPFLLWLDAPRIVTGIINLDITDPPDPLYNLLGHFFTMIPLGSLIFRIQIYEVLLAAISLFLVFRITVKLIYRNITPDISKQKLIITLSGVFTLISLAFSYSFWSQSENVEVFIMVALITIGVFNLIWWETQTRNQFFLKLCLIAFIMGLSLGTNPIVVSIMPSVLLMMVWNFKKLSLGKLFTLVLVGVLGIVLVYSYIPFRAYQHPFLNWENASSLDNLTRLATGAELNVYQPDLGRSNGFTGSPQVFLDSSLTYFKVLWSKFTPIVLPFFALGFYWIYRRDKRIFLSIGLVILTNFIFQVLYLSGNQESWYLASDVIWAVLAGFGFFFLSTKLINVRDGFYLVVGMSFLSLAPLFFWWQNLDRHSDVLTLDYMHNIFSGAKAPAIILGSGDLYDAVSYYEYSVERFNPGVIPITDNILYLSPWYRDNLKVVTDLKIPDDSYVGDDAAAYNTFLDKFFTDNIGKYNIYLTQVAFRNQLFPNVDKSSSLKINTDKYQLLPRGMLLQLLPKEASKSPDLTSFNFNFTTPNFPKFRPTFLEHTYQNELSGVMNEYAFSLVSLGDWYFTHNMSDEAHKWYQKATDFNPSNTEIITRLHDPKSILDKLASGSAALRIPTNWQEFTGKNNLYFIYPVKWFVVEGDSGYTLNAPTDNFKIQIKQVGSGNKLSPGDFVAKQSQSYGNLQNQGPARITNVESAYVKIFQDKDTPIMDFFLFNKDKVYELLVSPSNSSNMKQFDTFVGSIKF